MPRSSGSSRARYALLSHFQSTRFSDHTLTIPPPQSSRQHEEHAGALTPSTPFTGTRALRRPFLRALHAIDSIRDLVPFFNQASIAAYESVYTSGGSVDWEAVEDGLYQDMFDGRA